MRIKYYRVYHKDYEYDEHYHSFYHAPNAQRAKVDYYHSLADGWSEAKYTDIRVKLEHNGPSYCKRIKEIADYRGVPFVKAGTGIQAKYNGKFGNVVDGGGSGAYFRCYMEGEKSPTYFHPNDLRFFNKDGFQYRGVEDYLGC